MKKISTLFLISLLLVILCRTTQVQAQEKKQAHINGTIKNNSFTNVSLYQMSRENKFITETAISTENKFSLVCDVDKTDMYKLQFTNNSFVILVLQPGENIDISIDANDFLKQIQIKGSKTSADIYRNQNIIVTHKSRIDSINNLSRAEAANPKFDSISKAFRAESEKIKTSQDNTLKAYIQKNPESLAILFLPEVLPLDNHIDTYLLADAALMAKYPDNVYVQNLHMQISDSKKTAIGTAAPDFSLPDTTGKTITLSSFKGKYVLIDFWAAWCGPCRREMPNMLRLYNDFKDKNFIILGVSLDKTRANWVGAIKSDKLPWPQVSDLKFWQSEVAGLYNVKAIPYTVLLDKEGKIVAKNLRGEELYQKVADLLNQK